jgi:hypothetical protein
MNNDQIRVALQGDRKQRIHKPAVARPRVGVVELHEEDETAIYQVRIKQASGPGALGLPVMNAMIVDVTP